MERRFILPATFAAAFHAALLFGFPRPLAHPVAKHIADPITIDPIPVDLADPPEPVAANDADAKPSADQLRPEIEERPHLPPTDREFTVPVVPHPPVHVDGVTIKIPPGVGSGNGPIGKPTFNLAQLDNPPRTRTQIAPTYPYEGKRLGLSGNVTVEFVVDEGGHVANPQVVSSTNRMFEEPALRAVAKWRFEPGRKDGRVVRFRMSLPIVFHLDSEP